MKSWKHLNHLQVGKYAEYLVKIALVSHGLDVYSTEVDDRGIDFVIKKDHKTYFDIQKNIEGSGRNMRQGGNRQGGGRSVEAAED